MSNYTIGIDLGQVHDHSALAVVERLEQQSANELSGLTVLDHHHVRYLKRWDLGTDYAEVVKDTGDLMRRGGLQEAVVVLDATGVGRKVADLFLQAHRMGELGTWWPRPFVITGGRDTTHEVVPKRELIGTMQTLLQSKGPPSPKWPEGEPSYRFKIADALPAADLLMKELLAFKVKTTASGQDTYESAREADHDDLVLAVAMACWFRHNLTSPRWLEGETATEKVRYA